jgi:hypothetical protein
MTNSVPNVGDLLATAQDDGVLSAAAMQALDIPDLGAQIQAGLGINCDDVTASEVVLVTLLIDDSGSIRMGSNAQLVRDGHNTVLDALLATKQKDGLLLHTRYLNGTVLNPYRLLDTAERMDTHNYNPTGGTPLYDQAVVVLGTVLTKAQEFADQGVPVRTVTLIVSDGADAGSRQSTSHDVGDIVRDMLRAETHIVAAMGIDDGYTDFGAVFREMGMPTEWVLTPNNTPTEIRQAFQVFSQSAVRASQTAGTFSQTALGGFGTP